MLNEKDFLKGEYRINNHTHFVNNTDTLTLRIPQKEGNEIQILFKAADKVIEVLTRS